MPTPYNNIAATIKPQAIYYINVLPHNIVVSTRSVMYLMDLRRNDTALFSQLTNNILSLSYAKIFNINVPAQLTHLNCEFDAFFVTLRIGQSGIFLILVSA